MRQRLVFIFIVSLISALSLIVTHGANLRVSLAWATASVTSSPTVTNIPHAGVDIPTSSYFTAQTDANYFLDPGFEFPQLSQTVGLAGAASSTTYVSTNGDNPSAPEPSNFWTNTSGNETTATVRVGTCSDGTNNYCINSSGTVLGGGCASGGTCNAGTNFSLSASSGTKTGGTLTTSYSAGATVISVSGLPANYVIPASTEFLIAGDTQIYGTSGGTANGSGVVSLTITNTSLQQNESSGAAVTFGIQTFTCSSGCPTLAAPTAAATPNGFGGGTVLDSIGIRTVVTDPQAWPNIQNNGEQWPGWSVSNFTDLLLQGTNAYQGDAAVEINASGGTVGLSYGWDGTNSGSSPAVCSANHALICTADSDCSGVGGTCLLSSETGGATLYVDHPIPTGSSNWQFSFWATSAASGMSCTAVLQRGSATDMLNHTFTIAQSSGAANGSQGSLHWTQYTATVTPEDISSNLSQLNFTFNCSGGTGYFDNFFLGQTTNQTLEWNPDTITSLEDLQVGTVRQAPTANTGGMVTAAQLDSTNYLMPPSGDLESATDLGVTFSYGALTALAADIGASPWYTVPMAWPDSDYTQFGDDLCTWQTADSFPLIVVECNNENWNFEGGYWKLGSPYYPGYGLACGRAFALVKAAYDTSCSASDSTVRYLYNELTGNDGVMASVQANYDFPNTSQYGISDNFYNGTGNSSATTSTVVAAQFANNFLINALNGTTAFSDVGQLCQGLYGGSSGCNQIINFYEGGPATVPQSPVSGSNLASSEANVGFAGAGIEVQTLLQALTIPPAPQAGTVSNTFQLAQQSDAGVDVWGIVPANYGLTSAYTPVYPWYRSGGLGLLLYNEALGTTPNYYPVSNLPSGITGGVYKTSGSSWTAIFSNGNSSSTAVSITFPTGTVPTVADTINSSGANGLADNNEATNTLTIGSLSGGVSYSGQTASFTIPAYGAVALLQSGVVPPGNANTNPGSMVTARR